MRAWTKCPYVAPIIVVPRKSKSGIPLAETKILIIDYRELNKQISKVQTTQEKSKGSLALIETAKIDHIWSKLRGAKYFSILDIHLGFHHISIHPDSSPKTAFICPYGKCQWKRVAFGMQTTPSIFLNLMIKFFSSNWMNFLVFWMDNLLIYSETEEEHLNSIKLKILKCQFFKKEIEYLGHLVSGEGISPLKQTIKAITDLAPTTNLTEARHIIGLVGYKKFFCILNDTIKHLNELTKKNILFKWTDQCKKI